MDAHVQGNLLGLSNLPFAFATLTPTHSKAMLANCSSPLIIPVLAATYLLTVYLLLMLAQRSSRV